MCERFDITYWRYIEREKLKFDNTWMQSSIYVKVLCCCINYYFCSWRRFYDKSIWCCKLWIPLRTIYLYPLPLANVSNVYISCWRKKKTNMVHCWNFNWRHTHLLAKDNSKRCKTDYLKSISVWLKCIESWSDQIWFISTMNNPQSVLNSHIWCAICTFGI